MNVGNLFNFSGRIGRAENLFRGISGIVAYLLIALIAGAIDSGVGVVIVIVAYLAIAWFGLSSNFKRWHDRGKSGKWVFLSLIPIIGAIWSAIELGFMPGTDGANEYGLPGSGSARSEPELEYDVIPSRYS